jgi:hypothetical protein
VTAVGIRIAFTALAACAVVVAIVSLRGDHRCAEVKHDAAQIPLRVAPASIVAESDRCGDARDKILIATYLVARGRLGDANEIARRMTRSNPDDYVGWLALWNLTRDPAALARAHALNPRGTPAPR